jgi:hypothetical protein
MAETETIQSRLQDQANNPQGYPRTDNMMREAADHIDFMEKERDTLKKQNEVLTLALDVAKLAASEWLTLPWGGVVRKSEVVCVTIDNLDGEILYVTTLGPGGDTTRCPCGKASHPDEAKAWLADIEGQLGITR